MVQQTKDEDLLEEYKLEMQSYMKRRDNYNDNKVKAYGLLFGQCSKSMQNKILERDNFDTTIEDNPIELIKVIKQEAMSFQTNKHPMASMLSSLKAFVTLRQKEQESLIDYTKRFNAAKDALNTQFGGALVLAKYITLRVPVPHRTVY